jgi:hypothetical protein
MSDGMESQRKSPDGIRSQTEASDAPSSQRGRTRRREITKGAVATAGAATAYATPAVRALKVARAQTVTPVVPPPPTPTPVVGQQGCTPGFFKNNPLRGFGGTGFTPNQTVGSVFTIPAALSGLASATLLDALDFPGGTDIEGGAQILLRAGVAALLNAAHPQISFPLSASQVMSQVNTALASGNRDTMIGVAAQLDALNNLGCPLPADPAAA